MKNSIRIKGMAGYLNFICDNSVSFPTLITDLRARLEIIQQKKTSHLPCAIWLENRKLSDCEKLELSDTFKNFGIYDFECIN